MSNRSHEEIRASFVLRRAIFWILALALGVLLAIVTIAHEDGAQTSAGMAFAGVGGVIVYALYSLLGWRCPGCNQHLGRSMNPEKCSRCGASFR